MTADLPASVVPPRAIDVLRDQIAPTASDEELVYLGQVGQRLGLDPIAGHLVLIERWDKRLGRAVNRPTITAEGRLVLAERSGELVGIDGPEWTGPRDPDGGHTWAEVWDDDDPPHAARCLVWRRGWGRPVNGTTRWQEFAQTDRQGRLMPTWAAMPAHMLGKTALSLALRRAFPGVVPSDVEVDDLGAAPAAVDTPRSRTDAQGIDEALRVGLLQRAAALAESSPRLAQGLRTRWKGVYAPGPAPSLRSPSLTAGEAELFRRWLVEAEQADQPRQPWAPPDDDDQAPEAVDADSEPYDPADSDSGRPFE